MTCCTPCTLPPLLIVCLTYSWCSQPKLQCCVHGSHHQGEHQRQVQDLPGELVSSCSATSGATSCSAPAQPCFAQLPHLLGACQLCSMHIIQPSPSHARYHMYRCYMLPTAAHARLRGCMPAAPMQLLTPTPTTAPCPQRPSVHHRR